jgi:hypothetical protein
VISRIRKPLLAGLLAACTVAGASTLAYAVTSSDASAADAQAAAADVPPALVEEFDHPDAARILKEKGVILHKGDGHIFFAECDGSPQQIRVWTRQSDTGTFCFQTTGPSGYLSLELPEVFALQTAERAIHAELTAEGKTQEVDVPKNKIQGIGEGTLTTPTVLLELRVTG